MWNLCRNVKAQKKLARDFVDSESMLRPKERTSIYVLYRQRN
jgi:hypothetical protein